MLGQELTVTYLKGKILYLDPNWPENDWNIVIGQVGNLSKQILF